MLQPLLPHQLTVVRLSRLLWPLRKRPHLHQQCQVCRPSSLVLLSRPTSQWTWISQRQQLQQHLTRLRHLPQQHRKQARQLLRCPGVMAEGAVGEMGKVAVAGTQFTQLHSRILLFAAV